MDQKKTPYLDTFHAVLDHFLTFFCLPEAVSYYFPSHTPKNGIDWGIFEVAELLQRAILSKNSDDYCYLSSQFYPLMQNKKREF